MNRRKQKKVRTRQQTQHDGSSAAARSTASEQVNRLLSIEEVADFLALPVATIYRWRHHKQGPAAFKIGKHLRYRMADVEAWLLTLR